MVNTIDIKNIGPVEQVKIPVPKTGGVVVLRGRNGSGKTKTLEAVEAVAAGKGGLSVRDGEVRGEVHALGVTLKVGRATRRTGELEVETLEGRFNVADLVDPQIKSPDAADARRIKALVQVAGVQSDPSIFYGLAGGKSHFQELVSAAAIDTDDLVVMADRIKRDLEAAARTAESRAKHAHAAAEVARNAVDGIDLTAMSSSELLQDLLEDALSERSALVARAEDAEAQRDAARQAAERLQLLSESYSGPTATDARRAEKDATEEADLQTEIVRSLESKLRECRQDQAEAEAARKLAVEKRQAAEHHEELISECKSLAEAALPETISQEQLEHAAEKVARARSAVEQGALVRQAKKQVAEGEKAAAEAQQHAERAAVLRDAARSTDEVLSSVVAKTGSPLRVEAGRLVLTTGRGTTYYSDLSQGERWKIALDIAIEAVGENGLLVVPQESWEGLDPDNRTLIAEHVRGRGTVVLTAEAARGDTVTAEVF